MRKSVNLHIDNLFKGIKSTKTNNDLKEEMKMNLNDKIDDYITQGMKEQEAFDKAIMSISDIKELDPFIEKIKSHIVEVNITMGPKTFALATLIYILLGIAFDLWHPGWVVYIVFLSPSVFKEKNQYGIIFFAITIIYILLGIVFNLWHPGWLLFIIVFIPSLLKQSKIGLLWVLSITGYLLLGFIGDLWHPGWIVFLVVIAIASIIEGNGGE